MYARLDEGWGMEKEEDDLQEDQEDWKLMNYDWTEEPWLEDHLEAPRKKPRIHGEDTARTSQEDNNLVLEEERDRAKTTRNSLEEDEGQDSTVILSPNHGGAEATATECHPSQDDTQGAGAKHSKDDVEVTEPPLSSTQCSAEEQSVVPYNSTSSVEVLSIKDNSTLTSGATTLTKCNKELRLVRGRLCAIDVLDVPAANQHHQQQTSTITTRTSGDNLTSSVGTFTIPAGKSVTHVFTTSAGKSGTSGFTTCAGKNGALKECQYKRGGWCL